MKNEKITSRENHLVKHFIRLCKSSDYRAECAEFICEGQKMLEEALRSGARINTVFYDSARGIPHSLMKALRSCDSADCQSAVRIIETDCRIISLISSVETSQGIVFSVKIPQKHTLDLNGGIIILDSVRDPGNIGTILRTADAFSLSEVVLCGSCADIYNPKVVRSTMGAIFRINAAAMPSQQIIDLLKREEIKLYASSLSVGCHSILNVDLQRCAVVIGNEAHGVSDIFLSSCDAQVIIPMSGQAESLNASVAAGIFMWEMRRCKNK